MKQKVITSGFCKDAQEASDKLNKIFSKLGSGWEITNFTVNTVENIQPTVATVTTYTQQRISTVASSPLICYSAVAVKLEEDQNKELNVNLKLCVDELEVESTEGGKLEEDELETETDKGMHSFGAQYTGQF